MIQVALLGGFKASLHVTTRLSCCVVAIKLKLELTVISVLLPPTKAAVYPMETVGTELMSSIIVTGDIQNSKLIPLSPVLLTKQYSTTESPGFKCVLSHPSPIKTAELLTVERS